MNSPFDWKKQLDDYRFFYGEDAPIEQPQFLAKKGFWIGFTLALILVAFIFTFVKESRIYYSLFCMVIVVLPTALFMDRLNNKEREKANIYYAHHYEAEIVNLKTELKRRYSALLQQELEEQRSILRQSAKGE